MAYSKKKNAICGIYKITNTINNKCYIGESLSIIDRWWIHNNQLDKNNHHSHHLQKSVNKYGKENFKFEILELCNKENLFNLQDKYINLYKADNRKFGYNVLKAGNKWSDEHKVRMKSIFKNNEKRKEANRINGLKKRGTGKEVVKYTIEGEYISNYSCIKLAAESENLDKSAVAKCCKRKLNNTGNFIFRYKGDIDTILRESKKLRKIISIDINGIEREYNSLAEAAKLIGCKGCGAISNCLSGKRPTCKGLKWRYKN